MKYLSIIRYILVALLLTGGTALAHQKRYVVDFSGKITDKNLIILNDRARAISDKYQMNVAFFLADDSYAGKMTLNDYATKCFQRFIGSDTDGFMMAWDSKALRWTMIESGKGKEILPKSAKTCFFDAYCDGRTHYEGVLAYFNAVDEHLSKVEKGEINFSFWETVKRGDKNAVAIIIGVAAVAFILTVFSYWIIRKKVQVPGLTSLRASPFRFKVHNTLKTNLNT